MKKIKETKLIHRTEKELEAYKIVRKRKGGNLEIETSNEDNSKKQTTTKNVARRNESSRGMNLDK